jgi:hypothetical protein
VKEYLNSALIRSGPASTFYITEIRSNQAIIESALLYIENYFSSERKSSSKQDLEKIPLIQYASQFWDKQAQAIQSMSAPETDELVVEFLDSIETRTSWLRIYNPDYENWKTYLSD